MIHIDIESTNTGEDHAVRQIASAIQLALYGAGYEVEFQDARGVSSVGGDDIAGLLLATTFDNLTCYNKALIHHTPKILVSVVDA